MIYREKGVKALFHGLLLLLIASAVFVPPSVYGGVNRRTAVLPFTLHTLGRADYSGEEVQGIISTVIAEKGMQVVPPDLVNRDKVARMPEPQLEDLYALGERLGVDWVLFGSLTQIGGAISLDVKLLNVDEEAPLMSITVTEDDPNNLLPLTERAVGGLYNRMAGKVRIESIELGGNSRVEDEAVLGVMESKKGEAFDRERLDRDLRSIYETGFFQEVNIRTEEGASGKVVYVELLEKPSIGRIDFKGNSHIRSDDLKEESGIREYSILDLNEVQQGSNRMEELYRKKGYYNVGIDAKTERIPDNRVALIYEIDEGERVYIDHIEFIGNNKFSDKDLKGLMETSEKGFFSWIDGSGLLDQRKLEFDLHRITSFYHNQGYIKSTVGRPDIRYQEGRGLIVSIEVIEGPRYKVGDVRVESTGEGGLVFETGDLLQAVHLDEEEFFNREAVRRDALALKDLYGDEGYAFAEVTPVFGEDDGSRSVDVTYSIEKGKQMRIARININGNAVTRDKVIRRELEVLENGYFSGIGLRKSIENLNRLGYFEDVEIRIRKVR